MDASFFDANSAIESERDDEFYSVHDGIFISQFSVIFFPIFLNNCVGNWPEFCS